MNLTEEISPAQSSVDASSCVPHSLSLALGWILTPIYLILFIGFLCFYHILQVFARAISYRAHQWTVHALNFTMQHLLRIVGTTFLYDIQSKIPQDGPVIVIANHQSMYDIPILHNLFWRLHPKFIAKKELARGIPSISYQLRNGGCAIIDRSKPSQALPEIRRFAQYISDNKFAACIFPEGTRAKDGIMKPFKLRGLQTLIEKAPDAVIVPVVISGTWELLRYKFRPMPFGIRVRIKVLAPLDRSSKTALEIARLAESTIKSNLI
ncbi:MAG: 1-acyl-sn-glycerol-3-phosphate acyltransferase [Bdellovibrionales bacterium]|nr:1-acyl-sn-glycerol-3-phosphate acyltransferase [Bdellovibrionales bacterium]